MTEHATDWLGVPSEWRRLEKDVGAYHDGELRGRRLRQVEAHLAECPTCRAELERLRALATLLQESPAPADLMPPDRFVAQVGLRLPRRSERTVWQKGLEIGWRVAPLGLLGAWAFAETVFFVAGVVLIALRVGIGGEFLPRFRWDALQSAHPAWLVQMVSLLGLDLSGASESILQVLSGWGWGVTLHLVTLVVVGLLYFSWLASWWARRQHQRMQPASMSASTPTPTPTAGSRADGRADGRDRYPRPQS